MSKQLNKHAQDNYEKKLKRMYRGFIVMDEECEFQNYDVAVDHRCLLCGETVSARPMTLLNMTRTLNRRTNDYTYRQKSMEGRGCTICRTTGTQMQELADFVEELKSAHGGKFALAYMPQRFERDSGKYKQTFRCNDCGSQHYQTPNAMLDKKFKCRQCEVKKRQSERSKFYEERLKRLYEDRIVLRKRYHDKEDMMHECDQHHLWRATAVDMLNGAGCPHCKNAVAVKSIEPYEYRNRTYRLRNKRELKAFSAVLAKLKNEHRNLRTSLSFPTPILFGKDAVAFFDTKSRLAVDVMSAKAFKKNQRRKIPKSMKRAEELGMTYGIVLVMRSEVAGLWKRTEMLRELAEKKAKKFKTVIQATPEEPPPFDDGKEHDGNGDVPFD